MACATLKRSRDFDPLNSPSKLQRTPKRRKCSPIRSTSPKQSLSEQNKSPFLENIQKLSSDELSASVYEELKRIQRRQRLTGEASCSTSAAERHSPNKSMISALSMQNSIESYQHGLSATNGNASTSELYTKTAKEAPMFTAKQVIMLCERLWKEREEKLREQYDKVLHERLSEQYNAFLKFTQDQIMKRYNDQSCSYFS